MLPQAAQEFETRMRLATLRCSGASLSDFSKPISQSEKLAPINEISSSGSGVDEVNLADSDMKTVYGRIHWEQLL